MLEIQKWRGWLVRMSGEGGWLRELGRVDFGRRMQLNAGRKMLDDLIAEEKRRMDIAKEWR